MKEEENLLRKCTRRRPSLVKRHIAHASIVLRIPTAIVRTPMIRLIVLSVDRVRGVRRVDGAAGLISKAEDACFGRSFLPIVLHYDNLLEMQEFCFWVLDVWR